MPTISHVPLCSDLADLEEEDTTSYRELCLGTMAVSECTGVDSNDPNPNEIDSSHFTLSESHTIGVGGFGMVNLVLKLTPAVTAGTDTGELYAVKSISKRSVLARARPNVSPVASIFNELQVGDVSD